ncbi:hypothetical protein ACROYT_G014425 [Oculina patagonica]
MPYKSLTDLKLTGLELELEEAMRNAGMAVVDDAEKESITSGQKGPNPPTPGESCKEEEKDKVKSILYIMDKFSVSVQAYHKLSQQEPTLPRSYLVEACQQSLDDK